MTTGRVLIVDDDDDIRETLRDFLQDEGYATVEARNGQEALAQLRSGERICVVLLDLMMPTMDGWEFRQAQLADPAIAGVPVIAITASGQTNGALGNIAVLRKPLNIDSVLDAVSARC